MNKFYKISLFLLLLFHCIVLTSAQQSFNINSLSKTASSSVQNFPQELLTSDVERIRHFSFNQQLNTLSTENIGDILELDFFDDKKYKAIIKNVSQSINGTTTITAQITDTKFGYCFISVSEKGITFHTELPEQNEYFSAFEINNSCFLTQKSLSKIKEKELPCSQPIIPNIDFSKKSEYITKNDIVNDNLDEEVVIDLLIVYTQAAEDWVVQTGEASDMQDLINIAIEKSNLVLSNSNTGITFRIAHTHKTNYVEVNNSEDLNRIQGKNDGYMDEVHDLRYEYNADVVVFIPRVDFTGGVAFLLNNEEGFPEWAFALIRVQQTASSYTLVHEVGHNMGCGHHKGQTFQAGPGLYSYSAGWRGTTNDGTKYATIMTYEWGSYFPDGQTHDRIPYFSSPELNFEGVDIGDRIDGNNTLTLKQTKRITSRNSNALYDATLSYLSVNKGILVPEFYPEITNYTVELPYEDNSIVITSVPNNSKARIAGSGQKFVYLGDNSFNVIVTPVDEKYKKTYTIKVIRSNSNDATLKAISISKGTLTPSFSPDVTEYTVEVENNTTEISVTGITNDNNAKVEGNEENKILNVGENRVVLEVTAPDEITEKTYEIIITRKKEQVSIDIANDYIINMYPNPAEDIIFIDSECDIRKITILNQNGLKVKLIENPEKLFHIGKLSPGLYFVKIETEKGESTYKITKK